MATKEAGVKRPRTPEGSTGSSTIDNIEPSDPEVKKGLEEFRKAVTQKAILTLRDILPKKILHFNNIIDVGAPPGTSLHCDDLIPAQVCPVAEGPATQKVKADNGGVECHNQEIPLHTQVKDQLDIIQRETAELVEIVGDVKLWIQLNVPRIEDGNNFGVGIQEVAIQQLGRAEDSAFGFSDAIAKYHFDRANLAKKVVKYPSVADYREAIRRLDEKEWFHIKITYVDIRNTYSMLHDLLAKNWEKVVKPKNEDSHHRMTF